jgi:hypothetical protein
LDPERLLRCPPPPVSPDDAALPAPDELLLSRPHWIRIASTSSLVQLEVRTGAEGTSTTGSCFGAAGGSCDPDDRFFFGSSPAAAASLADDPGLTTNTVALFAVAAGPVARAAGPHGVAMGWGVKPSAHICAVGGDFCQAARDGE